MITQDFYQPNHGGRVRLDEYISDLNLEISPDGFSCQPMCKDGFAYMWAGAKATYGIRKGKVCFEVKVAENLEVSTADFTDIHVVRVGWSTDAATLQIGEDKNSFGYGGTAKKSEARKFTDYGRRFDKGDVIGCYLAIENGWADISYCVNGRHCGSAFKVRWNADEALFPHVLSKNCRLEVNFGQASNPYFSLLPGFKLIDHLPVELRVSAVSPPLSKRHCEVIMMVGLPGVGKSSWAINYLKIHPSKKYNVLGTDAIIDKMRVQGLPRKSNFGGRWDVLIKQASECFNALLKKASACTRNLILDQTNVYASARKRKVRQYKDAGYTVNAMVLVPTDEDMMRRSRQRTLEEGKEVPEAAVYDMKANFSLPHQNENLFNSITFLELQSDEAENLVMQYNSDANMKGYKSNKGSGVGANENQQEKNESSRHSSSSQYRQDSESHRRSNSRRQDSPQDTKRTSGSRYRGSPRSDRSRERSPAKNKRNDRRSRWDQDEDRDKDARAEPRKREDQSRKSGPPEKYRRDSSPSTKLSSRNLPAERHLPRYQKDESQERDARKYISASSRNMPENGSHAAHFKGTPEGQAHNVPFEKRPDARAHDVPVPFRKMLDDQGYNSQFRNMPDDQAHNVPFGKMSDDRAHNIPFGKMPDDRAHNVPFGKMPDDRAHNVPFGKPDDRAHNVPFGKRPDDRAHNVPYGKMPDEQEHNVQFRNMPDEQAHNVPFRKMPDDRALNAPFGKPDGLMNNVPFRKVPADDTTHNEPRKIPRERDPDASFGKMQEHRHYASFESTLENRAPNAPFAGMSTHQSSFRKIPDEPSRNNWQESTNQFPMKRKALLPKPIDVGESFQNDTSSQRDMDWHYMPQDEDNEGIDNYSQEYIGKEQCGGTFKNDCFYSQENADFAEGDWNSKEPSQTEDFTNRRNEYHSNVGEGDYHTSYDQYDDDSKWASDIPKTYKNDQDGQDAFEVIKEDSWKSRDNVPQNDSYSQQQHGMFEPRYDSSGDGIQRGTHSQQDAFEEERFDHTNEKWTNQQTEQNHRGRDSSTAHGLDAQFSDRPHDFNYNEEMRNSTQDFDSQTVLDSKFGGQSGDQSYLNEHERDFYPALHDSSRGAKFNSIKVPSEELNKMPGYVPPVKFDQGNFSRMPFRNTNSSLQGNTSQILTEDRQGYNHQRKFIKPELEKYQQGTRLTNDHKVDFRREKNSMGQASRQSRNTDDFADDSKISKLSSSDYDNLKASLANIRQAQQHDTNVELEPNLKRYPNYQDGKYPETQFAGDRRNRGASEPNHNFETSAHQFEGKQEMHRKDFDRPHDRRPDNSPHRGRVAHRSSSRTKATTKATEFDHAPEKQDFHHKYDQKDFKHNSERIDSPSRGDSRGRSRDRESRRRKEISRPPVKKFDNKTSTNKADINKDMGSKCTKEMEMAIMPGLPSVDYGSAKTHREADDWNQEIAAEILTKRHLPSVGATELAENLPSLLDMPMQSAPRLLGTRPFNLPGNPLLRGDRPLVPISRELPIMRMRKPRIALLETPGSNSITEESKNITRLIDDLVTDQHHQSQPPTRPRLAFGQVRPGFPRARIPGVPISDFGAPRPRALRQRPPWRACAFAPGDQQEPNGLRRRMPIRMEGSPNRMSHRHLGPRLMRPPRLRFPPRPRFGGRPPRERMAIGPRAEHHAFLRGMRPRGFRPQYGF